MVLFYDDVGEDLTGGGDDCGTSVVGRRLEGENRKVSEMKQGAERTW
jgi:hypothetical protein